MNTKASNKPSFDGRQVKQSRLPGLGNLHRLPAIDRYRHHVDELDTEVRLESATRDGANCVIKAIPIGSTDEKAANFFSFATSRWPKPYCSQCL